MKKRFLILPLMVILSVAIVGCTQTNPDSPSEGISTQTIGIGELTDNPDSYNDEMVTVAGEIVNVCKTDG